MDIGTKYVLSTESKIIGLFRRKICNTGEEFIKMSEKYQICDFESHTNNIHIIYCAKNNIIVNNIDKNNMYITYNDKKIAIPKKYIKDNTKRTSRFNGTTFIYGCFG